MNEFQEKPVGPLGVMAWLFETYRVTASQLLNHLTYFVGALMLPATALGVAAWYAFKDATLDWTSGETVAETGISVGGEWSVAWAISIYGIAVLIWFIYSVWSGFTAVLARQSSSDRTLGELLTELKPLVGIYLFGAFIQYIIVTIALDAPVALFQAADSEPAKAAISIWQLLGLGLYIFWLFKTALWVSVAADEDASWRSLKKRSFAESKFFYLLPRVLVISVFFFFVNLAITGIGNILIATFGLASQTESVNLAEDWSLPVTAFIGESIWVAIIKAQFLVLSFGIIGALWCNGMIIARDQLSMTRKSDGYTSSVS